MQKVGVSIRLGAQDVANIEHLCEVLHIKVSEWFRTVIEQALDEAWQKHITQKEDKTNG